MGFLVKGGEEEMKKFLAGLGILSLVLAVAAPVLATTEGTVSATVTPQLISVSVSPTTVDYDILDVSTSDSSRTTAESAAITATNDGNITETFNIKGSNATGGSTSWTLSSTPAATGTVAGDRFAHRFDEGATFTDAEAAALDSVSYKQLKDGVTTSGTADFVLQMNMPTSVTDAGDEKTTTVTVVATAS